MSYLCIHCGIIMCTNNNIILPFAHSQIIGLSVSTELRAHVVNCPLQLQSLPGWDFVDQSSALLKAALQVHDEVVVNTVNMG